MRFNKRYCILSIVKENSDTDSDKSRRYLESESSSTASEKANTKKNSDELDKERLIPPQMPQEFVHIVRPAYLDKERSIISLTSKLANTVRDKADETINSIIQVAGPLIDNDFDSKKVPVPVSHRETTTNKKDVQDIVSIEKKWITKKTRIDVPVRYEKIYLNGQELRFGIEEAVSEIKDRFLDIVSVKGDKESNLAYKWVPLFGPDTEIQTEFPLYAEELVITKRKVMIGKVVIRKRQIIKEKSAEIGSTGESQVRE